MAPTLDRVIGITSRQTGLTTAKLDEHFAIDHDICISGDDVTELAEALAAEFGEQVWQWPWQRSAQLDEPHLFTSFWFIWRLLSWPIRGRLFDPFERLELGHIAAVIENGQWFEP